MQKGKPIAYASRSLTKTEQKWALIEKELLAIVFAVDKFDTFIYAHNDVTIHSDHKPLKVIIKKDLSKLSSRIERMSLKLLRYPNLKVIYVPGRELFIADTLSRAFLKKALKDDAELEYAIHSIVKKFSHVAQEKRTISKVHEGR